MEIPGFYENGVIEEIIKPKITSDNLTYVANYWITDKGDTHGNKHGYSFIYEKYFLYLKQNKVSLLEIGAARGSSLKMWASWFDNIEIDSLDINVNCKDICKDFTNIHIILENASSFTPVTTYDIIIDDGCHLAGDIIGAFNNLFLHLNINGIYVIEDMDSCKNVGYIKCVLDNHYKQNISDDNEEIKKNTRDVLDIFLNNLNNDASKEILYQDDKIIFIKKLK
jgi:hypothetical protein